MTRSLRSILGTSGRVTKRRPHGTPSPRRPSPLATASGPARPSPVRGDRVTDSAADYFHDALDGELIQASATDLVPAMAAARAGMFSPLPERSLGMNSVRQTALLQRRAATPQLTTVAHLQALLPSPTEVERQLAALVGAGIIRRIGVPRRADAGTAPRELLILAAHLEDMLRAADMAACNALLCFLAANPSARSVPPGTLSTSDSDGLVRAGFLAGRGAVSNVTPVDHAVGAALRTRPEDASTLMSLQSASSARSGSLGAVGGAILRGFRYGIGIGGGEGDAFGLDLAVPGQGPFLRLVTVTVDHIVALLSRQTRFGQVPESTLREWWDCAAARDTARLARGAGGVVLAVRTRKWRHLDGVSFDWALAEALGAGVVEVFDAGPVGRGVRLV